MVLANLDECLYKLSIPLNGHIAFVGAGGKTSVMSALGTLLAKKKHKVFIATTTLMGKPKTESYGISAKQVIEILETEYCAIGGALVQSKDHPLKEKLAPFSTEEFNQIAKHADTVLIEADGARLFPLKVPETWEPVIPPQLNAVIISAGLDSLAKKPHLVCHRLHKVLELLGRDVSGKVEDALSVDDIAFLLLKGYLEPLREGRFPGQNGQKFDESVVFLLNKIDLISHSDAEELGECLDSYAKKFALPYNGIIYASCRNNWYGYTSV